MRPITYILLALLALMIGGKIYFTVLRKKVRFICIRSEFLPEGFLKEICPQMRETDLHIPDQETLRTLSCSENRFLEIAEYADPDAPNQAVLFIEDSNIVLVSAGVAARIVRGDKRLARKVARWTENIGGAYVIIANFGLAKYSNN